MYQVRDLPQSAHAFLFSSYVLSGLEGRFGYARIRKDDFCHMAHARLEQLLQTEPEPMCIAVASKANPDWFAGWLFAHAMPGRLVVHWSYVKQPFRHRGLATALLVEALKRAGDPERIEATHKHASFHGYVDASKARLGVRDIDLGDFLAQLKGKAS